MTETHAIQKGRISFPKFKIYEFPDSSCNYEHPRGGICVLVKLDKMYLIKSVKLLMTDFMETTFANGLKMVNLYIPPVDSVYYDEQYVQLLCSEFWDSDNDESPMIAMGDTNTRLGDLTEINKNYNYNQNPDKMMNENGKYLRRILCNATTAIPVNHMVKEGKVFDGGFTFERNEKKSQIDWCFGNKASLPEIKNFAVSRECPKKVSDHLPIITVVNIDATFIVERG